ncbi:hypothetical protein H7X46_14395 [Pseudonocardia sp. C8]|uniref:hypothetical protein n=1 Tax=Pseudonocardia sp. C8 TaxID=2762759 RepID=UPI0016424CC3|nr:hypothetical protein [Pseudonocardia sp. C8]MBC3192252.1 hypothetical protein [Pseudonocardia sp. C8]
MENPCFIGSFLDDPGEGVLLLRGDLDAGAVVRVGHHIDDFLAGPTRFLTIEAHEVHDYDAGLLALLGRAQRRLGARRGMLQVRGLRPAPRPDPARAGAGAATPAPEAAPPVDDRPTVRCGVARQDRRGRHRRDRAAPVPGSRAAGAARPAADGAPA